jgi:hypothetical protein
MRGNAIAKLLCFGIIIAVPCSIAEAKEPAKLLARWITFVTPKFKQWPAEGMNLEIKKVFCQKLARGKHITNMTWVRTDLADVAAIGPSC